MAALARAGQSDSVRTRQSALTDLMAALRDPNPALKLGAVQALQGIHAPEANAALTEALQSTQDTPDVRAAAAVALGFPDNRRRYRAPLSPRSAIPKASLPPPRSRHCRPSAPLPFPTFSP